MMDFEGSHQDIDDNDSMNTSETHQDYRNSQLSEQLDSEQMECGDLPRSVAYRNSNHDSQDDGNDNDYNDASTLRSPPSKRKRNENAAENFNIKQMNDINLDEYSYLLDLEIPDGINKTSGSNVLEGRLVIDLIELENFKSYNGVKKIGPLSHGLSCVIGPNGSGKSNVFDSMLFVFDYNVKKCRARKASEFIHKSSEKTCTFAKVTIYFKRIKDEGGKNVDVERSSFSIAREITKDNKSTFFNNGKKISRDDLKNLLKTHGLGLDHDRFLILQGEVESISLLKPKAEKEDEDSLLGLLDDIIGTSRFKKPLEKINEAISELQIKVSTVNAKLRESEKYKVLLNEKTRKCIEHNRIKNAITDLKFQKFHIIKSKTEEEHKTCQEGLQENQNSINVLKEEVSVLENDIKRIEGEQVEVKNEFSKLQKEIDQVRTSLNSNELKIQELAREISRSEELLKTKEQKNEHLHKEITKLQNIPIEAAKEKEEAERMFDEYSVLEEEYRIKKKDAEEVFEVERSKWASEFDSRQEKVVIIKDDINNLFNDKKRLEIKLNQLTSSKTGIEEQIKNSESSIETLMSNNEANLEKKRQLLVTAEETEVSIARLKKEIQSYDRSIEEHSESISAKTEEYNELSKKCDFFINQENISPVSEIHKFLNSLNYPGFKGRLGDLASVDKKYDIALSTLGGRALDMFVVDDVKDGQYLVEQLKISKKGRGTFMCISEMDKRHRGRTNKSDCVPGTESAIDLLQNMSPQFYTCFYHVFRDSLVIDSIDSASQFVSQSQGYFPKIVTLDGNVFESSGKIVGGGKPISGLIGKKNYSNDTMSDSRKAELKDKLRKLNETLQDLRISLSKLREGKAKAESELRKKQIFLDDIIKIQKRNIQIAISNGQERLRTTENFLIELKRDLSNVAIDKDAYNFIITEIEALDDEIKSKEEYLREKEFEFNEVKAKVDGLYDVIVAKASHDYETCVEEKKAYQESLKELERKITLSSKKMRNMMNELQKNEEEIQKIKVRYENLQEQEVKVNSNGSDLIDKFDRLSRQVEEINEKMNLENGLHGKKLAVIDLKNEISRKDAICKDEKNNLKDLTKKLNSLGSKIENLRYIFYNSMNLLPHEIIEYRIDQQFYSKRIDEAEKVFVKSLDENKCDEVSPMVEVTIKPLTDEELEVLLTKEEELESDLKVHMEFCLDSLDYDAVSIYIEKQKIYLSNLSISRKVNKVYGALKHKFSTWTYQRIKEFDIGFNMIAKNVKNVYQSITLGGDAELEYCDMFDPYNFGIIYKIRPPSKAWRKLNNLSGGEKTLASLALIFGLHEYNPTPLYIMDEVDAALDFRNVSVIGRYIKSKTTNAQFIIVSLRKEMYELTDKCISIWKVKDGTTTGSSDIGKVYSDVKDWCDFREVVTNNTVKKNFESLCRIFSNPDLL